MIGRVKITKVGRPPNGASSARRTPSVAAVATVAPYAPARASADPTRIGPRSAAAGLHPQRSYSFDRQRVVLSWHPVAVFSLRHWRLEISAQPMSLTMAFCSTWTRYGCAAFATVGTAACVPVSAIRICVPGSGGSLWE